MSGETQASRHGHDTVNKMHILHGTWLNSEYTDDDSGFVLWAETSEERPARRASRLSTRRVKPHPFAASSEMLHRAWLDLMPAGEQAIKSDAKELLARQTDGVLA
jgi:hypothetical protein